VPRRCKLPITFHTLHDQTAASKTVLNQNHARRRFTLLKVFFSVFCFCIHQKTIRALPAETPMSSLKRNQEIRSYLVTEPGSVQLGEIKQNVESLGRFPHFLWFGTNGPGRWSTNRNRMFRCKDSTTISYSFGAPEVSKNKQWKDFHEWALVAFHRVVEPFNDQMSFQKTEQALASEHGCV